MFGGKALDHRAFVKSVRKEWNDFWRRVRGGSRLDIAILASAAALCVVLIAIAGCSLAGCMDGGRGSAVVSVPSAVEVADSDYDKDAASINETEFDGTILIETDDAGEDYIDETVYYPSAHSQAGHPYQLLWIAGLIAQEYAAYLDGKEDKTGGK